MPDIDRYTIREAELACNSVIGWNFGDGHLHDERLIAAIQRRLNFAPGQFMVAFAESQPIHKKTQAYRVIDAALGVVECGTWKVSDAVTQQPWLDVLRSQRKFRKRVTGKIDLSYRQEVRSHPIAVHSIQHVGRQRAFGTLRSRVRPIVFPDRAGEGDIEFKFNLRHNRWSGARLRLETGLLAELLCFLNLHNDESSFLN